MTQMAQFSDAEVWTRKIIPTPELWADRYMWQSRLHNWGEEKVEKEKGQFLSWKQEEGWQVEHYEDGQVWTW